MGFPLLGSRHGDDGSGEKKHVIGSVCMKCGPSLLSPWICLGTPLHRHSPQGGFMNIQKKKWLTGLLLATLAVAGAACGGSSGETLHGDGKALVTSLTGGWMATSYVMTDTSNDKTFDALKNGYEFGLIVTEDGRCLINRRDPEGKDMPLPCTLEETGAGQLTMNGNGHPFDANIDGDTMTWHSMYFSDSVVIDIEWERYDLSSFPTAPTGKEETILPPDGNAGGNSVTLESLSSKWKATSYVVTDPATGDHADLAVGHAVYVEISQDGALRLEVDGVVSDPVKIEARPNNQAFINGLTVTPFDVVLDGDQMDWANFSFLSGGHPYSLKAVWIRAS